MNLSDYINITQQVIDSDMTIADAKEVLGAEYYVWYSGFYIPQVRFNEAYKASMQSSYAFGQIQNILNNVIDSSDTMNLMIINHIKLIKEGEPHIPAQEMLWIQKSLQQLREQSQEVVKTIDRYKKAFAKNSLKMDNAAEALKKLAIVVTKLTGYGMHIMVTNPKVYNATLMKEYIGLNKYVSPYTKLK